jgi:hypothetical protein
VPDSSVDREARRGVMLVRMLRQVLPAILVMLGWTAAAPATAQVPDPLETTRRLAQAGAAELALSRADDLQPKDPRAPRWAEWEALRVGLLVRLDRDDEALKRATPAAERELPERVARDLWRDTAQAALKLKRGELARRHYARLLWSGKPEPSEQRQWRLAVIESYLGDRNVDEAYRSMLRFQQDFQPLERTEAVQFVAALLEANRPQDAATWLGQLDSASSLAAILRLRAGLIQPDAAIAQGRALAAKGPDAAGAWRLVQEAAVAQRNRAVEIEALEQRLALTDSRAAGEIAAQTAALWRAYGEVAQQTANQAHLLTGDDGAWADRASRLAASQPQLARALFGHLAGAAKEPGSRGTAQIQLVSSLVESKLGIAALRLYSDPQRHPVATLDPHVRYVLGGIASQSRQPAVAVSFWSGLATPAAATPDDWRARNIIELLRAGRDDAAMAGARALVEGGRPVPEDVIVRLARAAAEALDAYRPRPAEGLYALVLPRAQAKERAAILLGLGRARELLGEFRAAADAYLVAALAMPETEVGASRAREAAAVNLLRAGLKDDARAQYQWLARNARDAAVRESAARELARL